MTATFAVAFQGGRAAADRWGLGSGIAIGDVDGDSALDLVMARCDSSAPSPEGGPTTLLRQSAGVASGFPVFEIDADFTSMFDGTCAHAAALGDYDVDGDLDLFVGMDGYDRLYRNDAGVFVDVTDLAGVAGPLGDPDAGLISTHPTDLTSGAVWADINRDGLLDLYVLGHSFTYPATVHPFIANRLYLNRGDGTFGSIGEASGAAGHGSSQAALFADLDRDGELEIYVANDRYAIDGIGGVAELQPDAWLDPVAFDSEGAPTYEDRAAAFGVDDPRSSMGVALSDLNGDGFDDLYVSDFGRNHLQIWSPSLNRYADVAQVWGVALGQNPLGEREISWGVRFVDFDRDGREELIVINGGVSDPVNCEGWSQLDRFLRRLADTNYFEDITASVGWPASYECPPPNGQPMGGRGVVLGDLDGDGDDDLIVTPYIEEYRVYRNDTESTHRHRVRIAPLGTVSAPAPIGAVLTVQRLDGSIVRRTLYGGGDTLGQSASVLEAGLGADVGVLAATLDWPSGYRQRLDTGPDFVIDQTMHVVEPRWLEVSSRVVEPASGAVLTYRPVGETGMFLGSVASGRSIVVTRSDGMTATVTDHGDGTYTADLPHPGIARRTVLRLYDGGVPVGIRPVVNYR